MRPEDPMRARATGNGPADGWRAARIGAEARERSRREAARVPAEVDIGDADTPWVTLAFLAAAVATTLWEFSNYGAQPTSAELARAGGASLGSVATGDWWKLLTANLLHGDIVHVGLNAAFTVIVGRMFEHLAGRLIVVATMLWSALLSSAFAVLLEGGAVSIGASGVLFGLMGCALAIDPRGRTAVGVTVRPLLLINVIYTFVGPGISIGGHVGGLLAGVLVGAACWRRAPGADAPIGQPRPLCTLAVAAAAVPIVALLAIGPRALPGDAVSLRGRIVAPLLARNLTDAALTDGLTLHQVSCSGTGDPTRYVCASTRGGDRVGVDVRIDPSDDQPRIRTRTP